MTIIELFSQRVARERGEVNDVYTYDPIPTRLRVQMCHVLGEAIGSATEQRNNPSVVGAYEFIVDGLCREYGLFNLGTQRRINYERDRREELLGFYQSADTSEFLDAVQLSCQVIDRLVSLGDYRYEYTSEARKRADAALEEVNARFNQNAIGYRFESGILIRIDSEFVHAEVVRPALALLHDSRFKGAEEEFLRAHEHHRHGRQKEALNDALKSLESTLKAVFGIKGWTFNRKDPCKRLLDVAYDNELIPTLWANHFAGLRSMLEAGVPTVRNTLGGHGQGATPVAVPTHISAFALNQTAAAIIFLVEAMNSP